jgi:hypothetical protein
LIVRLGLCWLDEPFSLKGSIKFNKHPCGGTQHGDPVANSRVQIEYDSCYRALVCPNTNLVDDRIPERDPSSGELRIDLGQLKIKVETLRIRKMPYLIANIL